MDCRMYRTHRFIIVDHCALQNIAVTDAYGGFVAQIEQEINGLPDKYQLLTPFATGMASGLFLFKLKINGVILSRRMMLVK